MIETLASWVAVFAAALTLFVTLEQLTATARLRRKVTLWRTEAEALPNTYDAQILWGLHRSGIAKLVALDAVPTKWPMLHTVLGAVTVFTLFDLGRRWTVYGMDDNSEDQSAFLLGSLGLLLGSLLLAYVIFSVLHSSSERRKIRDDFLSEAPLLKPQNEVDAVGYAKEQKQVRSITSRALTSLSLGLGVGAFSLFLGIGLVPLDGGTDIPPRLYVGLGIAFIVFVLGSSYGVSRIIAEPAFRKERWKHRTPSRLDLP